MVIVSNGHFKFHLAPLAAELARANLLSKFITGSYPGPIIKALSRTPFFRMKAMQRLLDREERGIPSHQIYAKHFSEMLVQGGMLIRKLTGNTPLAERLVLLGFRCYAHSAVGDVRRSDAQVYHYRAGYGLGSVPEAKKRGLLTICDHSIANPEVVDYFVHHQGAWPASPQHDHQLTSFWSLALKDIRQADYLVVNSDFVKETFVRYGWNGNRIFVQYWGVDDEVLRLLPPHAVRSTVRPKLLFAGELSQRKGADMLVPMLQELKGIDFELTISGDVAPDAVHGIEALRRDTRVRLTSRLPRSELIRCMAGTDIFIFPSLVEGSARVIFEALAAGCFVITTPNSGSIVRTGENGVLIPPGSHTALAGAIRQSLGDLERVRRIGAANAALIAAKYTQAEYARGISGIYAKLLAEQASAQA